MIYWMHIASYPKETSLIHAIRTNHGYPLEWAAEIVRHLIRAYPRATERSLQVWGLSKHDLALFLARGDPFWGHFRSYVHRMEGVYATLPDRASILNIRIGIRNSILPRWGQDWVKRMGPYLDKLIESARITEQGSMIGVEEGKADRDSFPLSPNLPSVEEAQIELNFADSETS